MKVALIGFGNVGQGLAEILVRKRQELSEIHGCNYTIVAVATLHHGSIYDMHGLNASDLLNHVRHGGTLSEFPGGIKGMDVIDIIKHSDADVVLELSCTNFKDGEPASSYVREALKSHKHVVTSNKGPSLFHHHELVKLATESQVDYLFEGTVMSGTPVISMAKHCLAGCRINRIRGIWNGTTNYILSRMESGCSYAGAFEEAQKRGYLEADTSADIDGWDATAKTVILANSILGAHLTISEVTREGISGIDSTKIADAKQEHRRWKLIGDIERTSDGFRAKVSPEKLSYTDPLANINGTTNGLSFETDLLGTVIITGPGAGRVETAFAILNDLLKIKNK